MINPNSKRGRAMLLAAQAQERPAAPAQPVAVAGVSILLRWDRPDAGRVFGVVLAAVGCYVATTAGTGGAGLAAHGCFAAAAAAGAALRDADQALAPRLATLGGRAATDLMAKINQLGSEMVLTGDPLHLVDLQNAYKQLAQTIVEAKRPRTERAAMTDLLIRHREALKGLITARVQLNEDAQRFDDIQAYVAPSLGTLTAVAEELMGERWHRM